MIVFPDKGVVEVVELRELKILVLQNEQDVLADLVEAGNVKIQPYCSFEG